MRSLATRRQNVATSATLGDCGRASSARAVRPVIVETAGIGQSDSEIVDLVDLPVYVMTGEYGAASQLEKIDMLDLADARRAQQVRQARRRGRAARRAQAVAAQPRRLHALRRRGAGLPDDREPLQRPGRDAGGGVARGDARVAQAGAPTPGTCRRVSRAATRSRGRSSPPRASTTWPRSPRTRVASRSASRSSPRSPTRRSSSTAALAALGSDAPGGAPRAARRGLRDARGRAARAAAIVGRAGRGGDSSPQYSYDVRGSAVTGENYRETLSGLAVPKVAVPRLASWGDRLRFLLKENLPGAFPYTAGVYPVPAHGGGSDAHVRRRGDAGAHQPALPLPRGGPGRRAALDRVRLGHALRRGSRPSGPTSTARSATPASRSRRSTTRRSSTPGFDLCAPSTSVSMTINGPAPIILALFLNAAIDQQVERHLRESGRVARRVARVARRPGLPGLPGRAAGGRRRARRSGCSASPATSVVDAETYARIRAETLPPRARHRAGRHPQGGPGAEHLHLLDRVRAADDGRRAGVLHAERGAQLLLRLDLRLPHRRGRGEPDHAARLHARQRLHDRRDYLARGMEIDDFAPNLSFFFSNGMDPEYA